MLSERGHKIKIFICAGAVAVFLEYALWTL